MAIDTLNKLFVRVSTGKGSDIVTTSQSNPSKIYFVQSTKEIVNNGIIYGLNPSTAKDIEFIQHWIGIEPNKDLDTSTIRERLAALEAISVGVGATGVDPASVDNYITVSDNDQSAGTKTPKIDLHIVDIASNNHGLLDSQNAKAYIDSKAAAGTTKVKSDDPGIIVNSSANSDGSNTYSVLSNLKLVYKDQSETGYNESVIELRSNNDASLYSTIKVSDIIKNGMLNGTSYDNTTGYITLTFLQANGQTTDVSINVRDMLDINDMSVVTDSQKYLTVDLTGTEETGGSQAKFTVHTVDPSTLTSQENTGLADAWQVQKYVESQLTDLHVNVTGDDYITAGVNAGNNKQIDIRADVQELTASAGTVGVYDNTTGTQTTAPTAPTLGGTAQSLVDGDDAATKVKTYVDGKVAIEAARADANVKASIYALDSTKTSDDDTNIVVEVKEQHGKLEDVIVTTKYATIGESGEGKDARLNIAAADAGKLIKASDLTQFETTLNKRFTALDTSLNDAINALYSTQGDNDSANYISFSVTETDGKLTAATLDASYGSYTTTNEGTHTKTLSVTNGIAKFETVAQFVNEYDYWEDYSA